MEDEMTSPGRRRVLRLPSFAQKIVERPTLQERVSFKRFCVGPHPVREDIVVDEKISPITPSPHLLIIENLSPQFTQRSINEFAKVHVPIPVEIILPRIRILSVNENLKGTMKSSISKIGEKFTINTFAVLIDRRSEPGKPLIGESIVAYGRKSQITQFNSEKILKNIFSFFEINFSPNFSNEPSPTEGGSGAKFGGGLSRRSAAPSPAPSGGRFIIRVPTQIVEKMNEDELRRKGVVGQVKTNNNTLISLRFTRMEIRDAACESFIVSLEIFENREIGLSKIRDTIVVLENLRDETVMTDFVEISQFHAPIRIRPPSR